MFTSIDSAISRFSSVVNQVFSIDLARTASNDCPVDLGRSNVGSNLSELPRINNMLIKAKGSTIHLPAGISPAISNWVEDCLEVANGVCDDLSERYAYLTIDNQDVLSGESQRQGGWHLDGLQGDEVKQKLKNCFQFILVSNTPTEFCKQSFNTDGMSVSKHNVFEALGKQVSDENCFKINSMHTYLMHCYHLHRATKSVSNTDRLFLRLYLSHCPVTSVRATINEEIEYPFVPHTTTGKIPEYLVA